MTQRETAKSKGRRSETRSKRSAAKAPAHTSFVGSEEAQPRKTLSHGGEQFLAAWAIGGTGSLMARLRREHQAGERTTNPVTRHELAQLIDHFGDRPLPIELRAALLQELSGQRKRKTGPKSAVTLVEQIQDLLLLPIYDTGIAKGDALREWLLKRDERQKRYTKQYDIPTSQHVACHQVKKWLPKFQGMEDGSISNFVSKRRKLERALQDRPAVARLRAFIELFEKTG